MDKLAYPPISIPGGMPGATVADASTLTVSQQAANMQQQIRNDTVRELQQIATAMLRHDDMPCADWVVARTALTEICHWRRAVGGL